MSRYLLLKMYEDLEHCPSELPGVFLKTTHGGVLAAAKVLTGVEWAVDLEIVSRETLDQWLLKVPPPEPVVRGRRGRHWKQTELPV